MLAKTFLFDKMLAYFLLKSNILSKNKSKNFKEKTGRE